MAKQPFADAGDIKPQKLHPERLRPRLEARHSYAGHGRESFNNLQGKAPQRPAGPQRNVTHAAGVPSGAVQGRLPAHRFLSTSTMRQESLGDPDFSSIAGGIDAGPYAEVFSNLRSLDREIRPLIESGGVCRVLDRGRLVTVTRDYVPENVDSSNSNGSTSAISEQGPPETQTARKSAVETLFGNYRSVFASDNLPSEAKDYQEYVPTPSPRLYSMLGETDVFETRAYLFTDTNSSRHRLGHNLLRHLRRFNRTKRQTHSSLPRSNRLKIRSIPLLRRKTTLSLVKLKRSVSIALVP